jgi:hypothetical protein
MINIHLLCIPRQLDSCLVDGAPICCRFGLCSPDHANQDLTLCHYIICLDHGCHWGHRPAFLLPVDSSMVLAQSKTNSLLSMLQESSIGLNLLRDSFLCALVQQRLPLLDSFVLVVVVQYLENCFTGTHNSGPPKMHAFNCNSERQK